MIAFAVLSGYIVILLTYLLVKKYYFEAQKNKEYVYKIEKRTDNTVVLKNVKEFYKFECME